MLSDIKHVADDNFLFSRTAHWHIMNASMQGSQTAAARTLNFTSSNYGLQLNDRAVKRNDYEI